MAHLAPIKIFANVPYLSLSHASSWPHNILNQFQRNIQLWPENSSQKVVCTDIIFITGWMGGFTLPSHCR